jgi:type III secretory pathway lipoprotein EscJ
MNVLTTLNNTHDAEEILHFLTTHGVSASIEGKHSAAAGVFIPNGLSIQIHNQDQFADSVRLLKKFDATRSGSTKKEDFLSKLRSKKMDQLFVGLVTLLLAIGAVWIVHAVVK